MIFIGKEHRLVQSDLLGMIKIHLNYLMMPLWHLLVGGQEHDPI